MRDCAADVRFWTAVLLIGCTLSAQAESLSYPADGSLIVVPHGTPKVTISYLAQEGTVYEPQFYYYDTSNCALKSPTGVTSHAAPPFSITVTAGTSDTLIDTKSGTSGAALQVVDCGCPYVYPPISCPYTFDDFTAVVWVSHTYDVDVSAYTAGGDGTIRASVMGGVAATVTVPDFILLLQSGLTPASEPPEQKQITPAATSTMHRFAAEQAPAPDAIARYPLGSTFTIAAARQSTGTPGALPDPIDATYTLGDATITPAITDAARSVFPTSAVIGFDLATAAKTKEFIAVHLGSQLLTLTPSDGSHAITVRLDIYNPDTIGDPLLANPTTYDHLLLPAAHQSGMPPDLLKAQAKQETDFHPLAYRYEPLSTDLHSVSGGDNARTHNPYARYRLAAAAVGGSAALARGTDTSADDVAPRATIAEFQIDPGGGADERTITASDVAGGDSLISATNIVLHNVDVQHWDRENPGSYADFQADNSILNFTAQTTLAASYGLLQILYPTAIAPMNWKHASSSPDPQDVHPSFLFDTDTNANNGDGSVALGSGYDAVLFRSANAAQAANPTYANKNDYYTDWYRVLNQYNHGAPGCASDTCVPPNFHGPCYARCVLMKAKPFAAPKKLPIFP